MWSFDGKISWMFLLNSLSWVRILSIRICLWVGVVLSRVRIRSIRMCLWVGVVPSPSQKFQQIASQILLQALRPDGLVRVRNRGLNYCSGDCISSTRSNMSTKHTPQFQVWTNQADHYTTTHVQPWLEPWSYADSKAEAGEGGACLLACDHPGVFHITFCRYEHLLHTIRGEIVDARHPCPNVGEGLVIDDRVTEQYSLGTSVVRCDC